VLLKGLQALGFGVFTGLVLAMLAWLSPVRNAASEEALIFNADNADLFGEDPYFESTLQLQKLSADQQGRFALMWIDGKRQSVRNTDVLLPPCVSLRELFDDSVLIDNCGSYALLSVAGVPADNNKLSVRPVVGAEFAPDLPVIIDLRQNKAVMALLADYHQRLYKRPLSLRGRVKLNVQVEATGGRRYYLAPGDDKALFELLALQSGDRVKAVNGIALSAKEALTDIYSDLSERSQVALTLEREGRDRVLLLRF